MRKWIDLMEGVDDINALIQKSVKTFGQDALYGGNCGMFALALNRYLAEKNVDSRFILICRDLFDDDGDISIQDVIAAETSIYHIVLNISGKIYDGDGQHPNLESIADWVEEEYSDDEAMVLNYPYDSGIVSLIDNDTDWTISAAEFLKVLNA